MSHMIFVINKEEPLLWILGIIDGHDFTEKLCHELLSWFKHESVFM